MNYSKEFKNKVLVLAQHLYDAEEIRKELLRLDSREVTERMGHVDQGAMSIKSRCDKRSIIEELKDRSPFLGDYLEGWDKCHAWCIDSDDLGSMEDVLGLRACNEPCFDYRNEMD